MDVIVPKKKKRAKLPFPIVFIKEGRGEVSIYDAKYHNKGAVIKCKGTFKDSFEVNGYMLSDLIKKYPDGENLVLDISKTTLIIRHGNSSITINRLDKDGKKTIKKKLPHTKKPEYASAPKEKRVEFDDTWGFSARVPMPKSVIKKDTNY